MEGVRMSANPETATVSDSEVARIQEAFVTLRGFTQKNGLTLLRRISQDRERLKALEAESGSIAITEEGVDPSKWMRVGPVYVANLIAEKKALEAAVKAYVDALYDGPENLTMLRNEELEEQALAAMKGTP